MLTRWHAELVGWEAVRPPDRLIPEHERAWSRSDGRRAELQQLRGFLLLAYAGLLAQVCDAGADRRVRADPGSLAGAGGTVAVTGPVVFCSHASPDEPVVRAFAERLRVDAFDAWVDSGQDLAARINDGPRALHGGLMFFGTHTLAVGVGGGAVTSGTTGGSARRCGPSAGVHFLRA